MGACTSKQPEQPVEDDHRIASFHENLVRARKGRHRFESIYEVLEQIGHGGLCTIFKIRKREESIGGSANISASRRAFAILRPESFRDNRNNKQNPDKPVLFALKVINLALVQDDKVEQLRNEVEILKTLDHKYIIKAYETFSFKETRTLEIVMELCTGGDLHARMLNEAGAAMVTKQVLSAVSYMHDRNIIHRDLKLENVLWESTHPEACIKVIDFGLSKKYSMDNPILTERVGTLYSMSPETMQGIYTTKADLWSIGVCTYMLLTHGEKPFEGKTPKQLVAAVLQGNLNFENPVWKEKKVSDDAKRFIQRLLQVNPEDRVAAKEALYDPWFTSGAVVASESPSKPDLIAKVHEGIVKYADTGEFRKLALNVIAKKSTSEEIFELRKAFDEFDTLNTGTITLGEFHQAMKRFNYSEEQIEEIFRKVDVNHTDVINYTEFLAAALETQGLIAEHRYAEAFDQMDSDDTGYISRQNLRQILGKNSSEDLIDKLMEEADIKKDGRISYEEFLMVLNYEHRRNVSKMYDQSEHLSLPSDNGADTLLSIAADEAVLRKHGIVSTISRHIRKYSSNFHNDAARANESSSLQSDKSR